MANRGHDFAGVPLYWAVARVIDRGGMHALTVRAAAAEAGCSVGFMRHYYDTKSLLLACTYGLVTDTQLRDLEGFLSVRRRDFVGQAPLEPLGAERAAELLATYLTLPEGWQLLVGVQLSFLALAQHDVAVADAVGSHHARLREVCATALSESGVPVAALEEEAQDLWVLLIGLTSLVPGLATEDPDRRHVRITPDKVTDILRRHLQAAAFRHRGDVDARG